MLQCDNKIRLCLNINKQQKSREKSANERIANLNLYFKEQSVDQALKLGGNNMWQVINVPLNYISINYPIKVKICKILK